MSVKWRMGNASAIYLKMGYMEARGKVTPESVAPSEPIIETALITNPIAGKSENMNSANAILDTTSPMVATPSHKRVSCPDGGEGR